MMQQVPTVTIFGIPAERMLAYIPSLLLYFATVLSWGDLVLERQNGDGSLGRRSVVIAFACVTGFLLHRWLYSGHLPLSDLYESSMFLSWSLCLIHIVFIHGHNRFGAMTAPGAMLTYGFAIVSASGDTQPSTVLVPALQSHWLMMHVSMMMLSYAALLCGSLLAMAFLVTALLTEHIDIMTHNPKKTPVWSFKQYGGTRDGSSQGSLNIFLSLSMDYRERQLSQRLDHWSYRIVSLGFLFLTLGILSGAVWANEAWGYYWNWDPKETWALITWLTFAIYLHTRMTGGLRGGKPAIVASIGFFIIWIRYLGVNLLGRGLHSYGWLI